MVGHRPTQGGRHNDSGPRQRRHLVGRGRARHGRGNRAAAFAGSPTRVEPSLREVAATLRRHAEYLCDFYDDELRGCRDIRKHIAWYLKGFPAGGQLRHQLALVNSLAALDELLAGLDLNAPWPGPAAEGIRGRAGSPRTVALPDGWLETRELTDAQRALVAEAELDVSGG